MGVIIVIAVIALITVPIVLKNIETARKQAFEDNVYQVFSEVEHYLVKNNLEAIPKEGIPIPELEFKGNPFISGKIETDYDGNLKVVSASDGNYCAIGQKQDIIIYDGECDLSIPTCELTTKEKAGAKGWYAENPTVEVSTMPVKTGYLKYGIGLYEDYSKRVDGKGKVGKAEYKTVGDQPVTVYGYVMNYADVKGQCEKEINIDKTAPTKSEFTHSKNGYDLTVKASGEDRESGIAKYQFSIDGGKTWTGIQDSNTYTFKNLEPRIYEIRTRVYNGTYIDEKKERNLHTDSEVKRESMAQLAVPTYSSNTRWTADPVGVKVNFSKDGVYLVKATLAVSSDIEAIKCSHVLNGEYTCEGERTRNLEAGVWYRVQTSPTITFRENGSIVAQVVDGIYYKMASGYTVGNIDLTEPSKSGFTYSISNYNLTVVANGEDRESGIAKYQFSVDGGKTWTAVQESNTYIYKNLEPRIYEVRTRVYNGTYVEEKKERNLHKDSEVKRLSMAKLEVPTYSSNTAWTAGNVDVKVNFTKDGAYLIKTTVRVTSNIDATTCSRVLNGEYTCEGSKTKTLEPGVWYQVGASPTITFSENGSIIAQVADGMYYKSASAYTVGNIDRTVPVAYVRESGVTAGENGWYKGVTLQIGVQSTGSSGTKNIYYCVTTGSTCNPTSTGSNGQKIVLSATSTGQRVCSKVVSGSGVESAVACSGLYKIDTTAPTASFTVNGTTATVTCSDANGLAPGYSGTSWTLTGTSNVTKSYTCKDIAGNIANVSYTYKYNSCLTGSNTCQGGYNQVWSDCATTVNTCQGGYNQVWSNCATTTNTCQGGNVTVTKWSDCATTQNTCQEGCRSGTLNSNSCVFYANYTMSHYHKTFETWALCAADGCHCMRGEGNYIYCEEERKTCPANYTLNTTGTMCYRYDKSQYSSCLTGEPNKCVGGNVTTTEWNNCATGSPNACQGGYVNGTWNSCISGEPNKCQGGYVNGTWNDCLTGANTCQGGFTR